MWGGLQAVREEEEPEGARVGCGGEQDKQGSRGRRRKRRKGRRLSVHKQVQWDRKRDRNRKADLYYEDSVGGAGRKGRWGNQSENNQNLHACISIPK